MNCLCAIYVDRNQRAFLAQMTSFLVWYDVIYHFFPINSQYLMTWVVDSPTHLHGQHWFQAFGIGRSYGGCSRTDSVLTQQQLWKLQAMIIRVSCSKITPNLWVRNLQLLNASPCIIFEPTPCWEGLLPRVQNSCRCDHTCGRCFTKETKMLFWCLNRPTEITVAVTFVVNISYQTIKQQKTGFKRSRKSKKGLEI